MDKKKINLIKSLIWAEFGCIFLSIFTFYSVYNPELISGAFLFSIIPLLIGIKVILKV